MVHCWRAPPQECRAATHWQAPPDDACALPLAADAARRRLSRRRGRQSRPHPPAPSADRRTVSHRTNTTQAIALRLNGQSRGRPPRALGTYLESESAPGRWLPHSHRAIRCHAQNAQLALSFISNKLLPHESSEAELLAEREKLIEQLIHPHARRVLAYSLGSYLRGSKIEYRYGSEQRLPCRKA